MGWRKERSGKKRKPPLRELFAGATFQKSDIRKMCSQWKKSSIEDEVFIIKKYGKGCGLFT